MNTPGNYTFRYIDKASDYSPTLFHFKHKEGEDATDALCTMLGMVGDFVHVGLSMFKYEHSLEQGINVLVGKGYSCRSSTPNRH